MTGTARAPSWAFALVGLTILAVTWNGLLIGGSGLVDFLMVPAVAAAGARLLVTRRSPPIPWWLLQVGICIGLATVLSAIFPPDHTLVRSPLVELLQAAGTAVRSRSDVTSALKFVVGIVLVPLLVAAVATTSQRCRRLGDLWAMSALISAAVAVTNLLHLTHVNAAVPGPDAREMGLTIQPNHLGLICAMALPVVAVWFNRDGRWRIASVMAGGVLLGAVYASGSRAGAVTALFAVLVTVLLVPRLRRSLPAVVPIVGMLGILVLFFSNLSPQVAQKVRLSGSAATVAASDRQRSFAATLALKDVQARPLEGVGFAVIDDAHDIYLQLLAAGGIIMFASFLFYVAGAARIAVRLAAGPEHDLPLALGCSLMVWLLNGFVGNQVTDRYIFVPVGLLLALSLCAREPTGLASAAGGRPAPYQPGPDRLPVTAWR